MLIGEIWSNPAVMSSYLQTGMDSIFDFVLAEKIRSSVLQGKNKGIISVVENMTEVCGSKVDEFVNSTFLPNHDFPRLMTLMKEDTDKVKLVSAILLTLPDHPFIYYGDELGLKAGKHLTWLAMPWDEAGKEPGQIDWTKTTNHLNRDVKPVSSQAQDRGSLHWHFKTLIRLRNRLPALVTGGIERVDMGSDTVLALTRKNSDSSLLVIHNLSDIEQHITLPLEVRSHLEQLYPTPGRLRSEIPKRVIGPYETVIVSR